MKSVDEYNTKCQLSLLLAIIAFISMIVPGCTTKSDVVQVTSAPGTAIASETEQASTSPMESSSQMTRSASREVKENVSESLSVDLALPEHYPENVPAVQTEFITFDTATIKNVLFPHEEVVEKVWPEGGILLTGEHAHASISAGATFSSLGYNGGNCEAIFDVVYYEPKMPDNHMTPYLSTEKLPFEAPSEVEQTFLDLLKELGVENAGDMTVYALDYRALASEAERGRLEQEEEGIEEDNKNFRQYKTDWTQDDDCYFLIAKCLLKDIPVSVYDTRGPNDEYGINGTEAWALYNKDGLQYLSIQSFLQAVEIEDQKPIVSPEQALTTIKEKLGDLITDVKTTVVGVELNYAPLPSEGGIEAIPVWEFTLEEMFPPVEMEGEIVEASPSISRQRINAYSGAEFMSTEGLWT